MKWLRDPKLEHYLKRLKLEPKFEAGVYSIRDLDLKGGIEMQNRFGRKLNEDRVMNYGQSMLSPEAAFPACLVNRQTRPRKMDVWGGCHRLSAAALAFGEDVKVDLYVVETSDPQLCDIVPRLLNTWEAEVGVTREEKIQHALHAIAAHSLDAKTVAKWFGLKVDWVNAAQKAERVRQAIESGGVSTNGLSRSLINRMHVLSDDKMVLQTVASMAHHPMILKTEVEQIVKELQGLDTSLARMAALGNWEKILNSRKITKKTPFAATVRVKFLRLGQNLNKMLDQYKTKDQLQLGTPEDIQETVRILEGLDAKVQRLLTNLRRV